MGGIEGIIPTKDLIEGLTVVIRIKGSDIFIYYFFLKHKITSKKGRSYDPLQPTLWH